MRRAGKTGSFGLTTVFAVLAGLSLAVLAWREQGHQRAGEAFKEELEALSVQISLSRENQDHLISNVDALEQELESAKLSIQSLRDRAGNLEAQRDHLRAQVDQRALKVRELEDASVILEADLSRTRLNLLETQQLPSVLQNRLDASLARVEELEQLLDAQSSDRAKLPGLLSWEGRSKDKSVFALSGELPDATGFPESVYICDANGLILEGWLARIKDDRLLGHVEHWRSPVSALVKGEKVFILPREGHEEDF
jgi:hypothetical protein